MPVTASRHGRSHAITPLLSCDCFSLVRVSFPPDLLSSTDLSSSTYTTRMSCSHVYTVIARLDAPSLCCTNSGGKQSVKTWGAGAASDTG